MTKQELQEITNQIDVLDREERELEKELNLLMKTPVDECSLGKLKQMGDILTKHTDNLNEMKRLGRLLGIEV